MFRFVLSLALLLGSGCATRQLESEALANPESAEAWVALGDAYARAGRDKRARMAYGRALELAPDDSTVEEKLASSANSRDLRKGRKLILEYPDNDEAWGRAGVMAFESGYEALAVQYFQQAISLDPLDGEWMYYLSMLMAPEAFLALAEATMDAYPDDDELLGGMGWMLWDIDGGAARAQSCAAFERARALDSEDAEWRDALVMCAEEGHGDAVAAVAAEAACVDVDGAALDLALLEDPAVLKAVAESLLSGGAREQALAVYQRLLRVAPSASGKTEAARSVALLEGSAVLTVLEALVAEAPEDWPGQLALGDHHAALGDTGAAAAAWAAASRSAPNVSEVRARLALLPASEESGGAGSE